MIVSMHHVQLAVDIDSACTVDGNMLAAKAWSMAVYKHVQGCMEKQVVLGHMYHIS
jgi:hypothetical protein